MTDPLSIVGGIAAAPVVFDAYKRLLGPWLDGKGQALAMRLERDADARRVADWAARKSRTDRPGAVPPRVAASVLDQAQWAENEMVAEYLSGVLASARTPEGLSDRGQSTSALIQRLTSDQILFHYLLYAALRAKVAGRGEEFSDWVYRTCIVDVVDLLERAGWALEAEDTRDRFTRAVYGIERERLVKDMTHGSGSWLSETVVYTRGRVFDPEGHFLVFKPTEHGISLFLEAHGLGDRWFDDFGLADLALVVAQDDVPLAPAMRYVEEFPST